MPLNPHFRYPAPGANDPLQYDDPVTVPAGDIADNAYWKRDSRRSYPQLSVVNQAQFASLLTVGSAASPKVDLIGEAGEKALVAARQDAETGLAQALEKAPKDVAKDVFVDGLPPLPSGTSLASGSWDVHKYEVTEASYGEGYVTWRSLLGMDANKKQIPVPVVQVKRNEEGILYATCGSDGYRISIDKADAVPFRSQDDTQTPMPCPIQCR